MELPADFLSLGKGSVRFASGRAGEDPDMTFPLPLPLLETSCV